LDRNLEHLTLRMREQLWMKRASRWQEDITGEDPHRQGLVLCDPFTTCAIKIATLVPHTTRP
jgi:hypothetical protein